jgi:hypothetical protein
MKKSVLLFPLLTALLFPALLHRQSAGINILLLDLGIIALAFLSERLVLKNKLHLLIAAGLALSGLMSVFYGSAMAVTVTVISFILLVGILAAPYLSVLINGLFSGIVGTITSPFYYLKGIGETVGGEHGVGKTVRYAGLLIIPLIIVLIFISIYSAASPYFNRVTGDLMYFIGDFFEWLGKLINPAVFWIGVGGLVAGSALIFGKIPGVFDLPGEAGTDKLTDEKNGATGTSSSLRFELNSALLIFLLLNGALLIMNALDLWYVWIDFKWDGGFLKQFVHEGTWLLIFSIIISILLVLWFFRGSLNFYPKNNLLKNLTIIWIAQNIFLALSVGVRNFWYLHYFNLAFKRIFVFAFLLLVIYGLVTVILKVNNTKSLRYLIVRNSIAAYIVLVALSLFNWDMVIAKFNIGRAEKAFFHTDFMSRLDDSTLPVLMMNDQELQAAGEAQKGMFSYHRNYMSLEEYKAVIISRNEDFLRGYPQQHWLSWNLAEYTAYKKLTSH